MKKKRNKILLVSSCCVVLIALLLAWNGAELKAQTYPETHIPTITQTDIAYQEPSDYIEASVVSVVDGDTIWVMKQGVRAKVRLIGVDTPESVHPDKSKNTSYGKTAAQYTKERLPEGKTIYLQYDVQSTDKYGRDLAYVYIPDNANHWDFFNQELIEKGYGRVMTIEPNTKYETIFVKAEQAAKESQAGFWKDPVAVGWEGGER